MSTKGSAMSIFNQKMRVILSSLTAGVVMASLALSSLSPARGQAGATLEQAQTFINTQATAPNANLESVLKAAIEQDLSPELIVKVLSESAPANLQTDSTALLNTVISVFVAEGVAPALVAQALLQAGSTLDPVAVALALVAAGVDPVQAAAAVIAAASDPTNAALVQQITASVLQALNITDPAVVAQVNSTVVAAETVIADATAAEQQAQQESQQSAGDTTNTTVVAVVTTPIQGGGGGVSPN